jgi:glucose/arabinose dehydrogenase
MKRIIGLGLLLTVLTSFSVFAAQDKPAVPPEDDVSARLVVPQGFAVRAYAMGLSHPRLMTVGEDGSLYVAEQGLNQISRLTDADADGLAEKHDVIAENMTLAHSVEWHDGWLYVSEGNQIERIQDADGDGTFEAREVVTTNIPEAVHHVTRTVHFGPDGMMYVSTGSSSNNNPESDPRRAAILRFNPDGSIPADNPYATDADVNRQPVWAEGLRNSVDFLFTPDGKLWADHNGSDELGDDIPPEEVVINVEKGKHYGWPYCYTSTQGVVPAGTVDVQDTRVPFGGSISSCDQSTPALFTDLAHSAPLGMTMYTATAFPAQYQGSIFEAYHGSWNSSQARDCKVQMIVVKDGLPVSSEPFLTGFRDNDQQDCGGAWGRPAGVAVGKNGELFVSDDQNGNIYRVVYTG